MDEVEMNSALNLPLSGRTMNQKLHLYKCTCILWGDSNYYAQEHSL